MAAPAMIEPDVDFVGIRIPPNTPVSFADKDRRSDSDSDSDENENADENDDDMPPPFIDGLSLIHATQVALGPNPAPGRHTVMAIRSTGVSGKGRAFPIGTLEAGKCEQFSVDLMWSMLRGGDSGGERFGGAAEGYGADIAFMHSGKSDVFITGYKTVTTSLLDEERGYSSGEDDDELSDEFSSDEEASGDEEAPLGVPLPRGHKGDRGGKDFSSSDDEDESDEESESEDEEEAVPRTPAGKRPLGGGLCDVFFTLSPLLPLSPLSFCPPNRHQSPSSSRCPPPQSNREQPAPSGSASASPCSPSPLQELRLL